MWQQRQKSHVIRLYRFIDVLCNESEQYKSIGVLIVQLFSFPWYSWKKLHAALYSEKFVFLFSTGKSPGLVNLVKYNLVLGLQEAKLSPFSARLSAFNSCMRTLKSDKRQHFS